MVEPSKVTKTTKVNTANTGLNVRRAIFMAAVCSQTYTQFSSAGHVFLVPDGYHNLGSFTAKAPKETEQPFGFLLESKQDAILAFRGTSTAMEMIADLTASQVPFPYLRDTDSSRGKTHAGFTTIYETCRGQIHDLLQMVRVNKPLYITGHSLGAALATLAAVDIAAHYRPRTMEVYTFGGPRVGDPYFAFAHNGLVPVHQRIFNDNDLVVHLPPILYAHKHKLYYYLHARTGIKRTMPMGTQKQNHALETYFNDLASLDPAYTEQICASPPGWCMYRREQPQTQQQLRVNIRAKRG